MKGIFFDMDGVLIDSMKYHAEAMYRAVNEYVDYPFDKKLIYLLEGMPGNQLVEELFKRKNDSNIDTDLIEKIVKRKTVLFKEIEQAKPIEGARELIDDLNNLGCLTILVSGSSRKEVDKILEKNVGSEKFDHIVTGDDIDSGKPSPQPFLSALKKSNLNRDDVLVVENSPLGVKSAQQAELKYIITLNDTPLTTEDFKSFILPKNIENLENAIFKDLASSKKTILNWCKEGVI